MESAGLLLWPLWTLGMAWLLFGVGVTPALLGPLAYLLFSWPPLLGAVATVTQGVLVQVAITSMAHLSRFVPWITTQGQTGAFLVAGHGSLVPVVISQACSGADSALGAAIILPVLLTQYVGGAWRKGLLVVGALTGAILFNLLRLAAIMASIHFAGSDFTFGLLHPMLGFVLFALLALLLVVAAGRLGLVPRPPSTVRLAPVGWGRTGGSWLLGAALFFSLWPLFTTPYGAPGKPLQVRTADVAALLPRLPGFRVTGVQRFNDASILGPGAVSLADTYVSRSGAQVLAEVWSTPDLGNLESYGFRDCLAFHGERTNAMRLFDVAPATAAADYALQLPPIAVGGAWASYEDIEWESAVRIPDGSVRYLRYAVAALPQSAAEWPKSLSSVRSPASATGMSAIAMPPAFGSWPQTLGPTQRQLERFAADLAQAVAKQEGVPESLASAGTP
jgi:exosortase/archaeosortase family protein